MAIHTNHDEICERLKVLGYAHGKRIRVYGEEFDLTSNPVADGSGFAIEAISRQSGDARSGDELALSRRPGGVP